MKRYLGALVALLCVAAPIALVAAPAQADAGSPGCVTRAESRQVDAKGRDAWTRQHVTREFGTAGRAQRFGGGNVAVLYPTCGGGWSYFAEVDFHNSRATYKYYPSYTS